WLQRDSLWGVEFRFPRWWHCSTLGNSCTAPPISAGALVPAAAAWMTPLCGDVLRAWESLPRRCRRRVRHLAPQRRRQRYRYTSGLQAPRAAWLVVEQRGPIAQHLSGFGADGA